MNLTMTKNAIEATAITHAGVFHADDVFSTVLLTKLFDNIILCRTFGIKETSQPSTFKKQIIFDIGGGKYDHHQKEAKLRKSGLKYASFGLLWEKYGKDYLLEFNIDNYIIDIAFELFDKNFVEGIDAIDNGEVNFTKDSSVQIMSVSGVISGFNPTWDSLEDPDDCFVKAVKFAETIFDNAIESALSKAKAKNKVEEAIKKTGDAYIKWIMELDEFMPWEQFLFESKNPAAEQILYVTYPSNRGGYHVKVVPDKLGSFGMRQPFPDSWAGLRDEELEKVSGVIGATFCHSARFLCAAKDKSSAKMLAYKSGLSYLL